MAGNDTGEIVIALDGRFWAAPYGADLPDQADFDTGVGSIDADYIELGYFDENGVTIGRARTINDVPLWQSKYPGRRTVATEDLTLAGALRQWNDQNFSFAFGGGETTDSGGVYMYSPPSESEIIESTVILEWMDGTRSYRLVVPKGMVTETADVNLVRTDAANLGFTFGITPDGTNLPFYLLSDDPSFDPATS
jgi:hypothetical protein